MRKILCILFIGLFLKGCAATNTSGGNINITGQTSRIQIANQNYVEKNNCKFIKSTKHTHAGWSTMQSDINKNRIKIANETLSLNATHFVVTGDFQDGLLPDLRLKVSSTADIYDCNQKEKNILVEKKKEPKIENNIEQIPDNKIVPAGSGTGFFVTDEGHIITNNHVVDSCDIIKISYEGKLTDTNILSIDRVNDLAILKSDIIPNYIYSISDEDVQLLEDIIIAGYPLGKQVSSAIKTSKGSVTALAGYRDNYSEFQTDAALNAGNSGGPIINQKGNVLGVAVATFAKKEGVESFNFGIKSSTLSTFVKSNGIDFKPPNKRDLTNKELGQLVTNATVYIECHMTFAKIKKIMKDTTNQKALFNF